jgi:tripartite-type tricarboxylate transporter receptor subunit TctC
MRQPRPSPHARRQRRLLLGALGAVLCGAAALPAPAQGQAFPSRGIRIVPFGTAGGPIDTIARIYADKLKARWGQPVIVDAKPGASGTLAADAVAKAAPDGHTVMMTLPLTHINNAILQANSRTTRSAISSRCRSSRPAARC